MLENMGCLLFHVYSCLFFFMLADIFKFWYSFTPCEGVALDSMKRKDWALVSFSVQFSSFYFS